MGAYAASKSALEDSMRAWRVEHPDIRFITLVIGTTVGTDFATNFQPEAIQEAFPVWAAQGNAPSEHMQPDEVAGVTVDMLGSLLGQRSVGIESMVLRCPAPLAGTAEALHDAPANASAQV